MAVMDTTQAQRLGPVELMPGISRGNAITKLYASGITIAALTGMSLLQGYILTEHLDIPRQVQGTLSGDLSFWTEIVMLVFFVPFGVLADRIGRRPVYVLGILLIGASWALYPLATSVTELTLFRMIYAIGVAAAAGTLSTMVNDYPTNSSRGKYIGFTGMMNILGTIFVARIIGSIPEQVSMYGYDAVTGGTIMYMTMAGLCFVTGLITWLGLKGGTPVKNTERLPIKELYKSGLQAGRDNSRIAIAYAAALAARSDVVIKGLFLALWAIQSGREQSLTTAEAMTRFGSLIAIMYVVSFIASPLFGWYLDKVNRMTAMCTALIVAAAGYLSMYFVTSPLDFAMLPLLILLTLGTGFMVKAQMALIGQEAPVNRRASIIATGQMFGAFGILVFTGIGGRLFDAYGPWAPFAAVGAYQLALLCAALIVRKR
jgi:MFS family permease